MLKPHPILLPLAALMSGCGGDPASPPKTASEPAAGGAEHAHHHSDGQEHTWKDAPKEGHTAHGHHKPAHGHDASRHDPSAHGHHGQAHGPLGHRFEKPEEWTGVFDDPARDAWQRPADVVSALRITPGMTAVDLGAGTGYFLPHLARAVGPKGAVIGLDIEPEMVRYMRERAAKEKLANVRAEVAKTDDPGLPASSVDRILIVNTWHHIASRPAYAAKLRAALKPGGLVAIVDFTMTSDRGPPKDHRITPEQVIEELKAGGLAAELLIEELPDQYIVTGKPKP
jgi:SAM-dependent methyltransferase